GEAVAVGVGFEPSLAGDLYGPRPSEHLGIGHQAGHPYAPLYALEGARTLVRATLRHCGYCETWSAVVQLGLTAETRIPGLAELRWGELMECMLPPGSGHLDLRVAAHLRVHPSSRAVDNLRWLGLFGDERIGDLPTVAEGLETPAEAMIALLRHRLELPPGGRDLVILHHVVSAKLPDGVRRRYTSTLVERGGTSGTAMARTVGLPAALATLSILDGTFPVPGAPIPTDPRIVDRLLPAVEKAGMRFVENAQALAEAGSAR
ncbi:MAG: saccharopine dehydrogenase C-terminal domain-containing protein, partial [Myxococcota bacterium]